MQAKINSNSAPRVAKRNLNCYFKSALLPRNALKIKTFKPLIINTSKKSSNLCILLIIHAFKSSKINTSKNKDLKSFRINTSKIHGRGAWLGEKSTISGEL